MMKKRSMFIVKRVNTSSTLPFPADYSYLQVDLRMFSEAEKNKKIFRFCHLPAPPPDLLLKCPHRFQILIKSKGIRFEDYLRLHFTVSIQLYSHLQFGL